MKMKKTNREKKNSKLYKSFLAVVAITALALLATSAYAQQEVVTSKGKFPLDANRRARGLDLRSLRAISCDESKGSGEGFFMYFRAYGPTKEFFDKSWKLNDIEKIK